MGNTKDPGDGRFNYYSGEHMLLRGEPATVKAEVQKIGIDLNEFKPLITGIYARPRSVGFDFFPNNVKNLLKAVEDNPVLHEDDRSTKIGAFMASNSKGLSFRQEGDAQSLHFIISFTNVCNVHIDTHGLRDSCEYGNLTRVLGHGYWDLAPDIVPGAFFAFGDKGVAGLMIAPMKGVDGEIRTVVGIAGHW
jgi:hypothetical protein